MSQSDDTSSTKPSSPTEPQATVKAPGGPQVYRPGEQSGEPMPREIGGREGPEPTRFGDWEKNGRCIDF